MIRHIIYVILIAGVLFAPVNRVDVGALQPVEVISVYHNKGQVIVETDTGDMGQGKELEAALVDLMATSSAVVYLDTAEYLLIDSGTDEEISILKERLKGSTKVAMIMGHLDLKDVDSYLKAHNDFPVIREWKSGEKLPILTSEKILKKNENKA